jgi:hypothetical protein
MKQMQIPAPLVVNILVTSLLGERFALDETSFAFFMVVHSGVWAVKVSTIMPVQHVFQYVHQLAQNIYFIIYCK